MSINNEKENLTGNKGEWSEPYVFLKLLGEGRIYAADANLHKLKNIYFPILKILGEVCHDKRYKYCLEKPLDNPHKIKIYFNNQNIGEMDSEGFIKEMSSEEFSRAASFLLKRIKSASGQAFSVPEITNFLNSVHRTELKMKNTEKADITLQLHDINTEYEPIVGFSIKSQLGSPSTLINASKATNFIFRVDHITASDMNAVNSIADKFKIRNRMKYLTQHDAKLTFLKTASQTYFNNLVFIDSLLPQIIAQGLWLHYQKGYTTCAEIMQALDRDNPLNFPPGNYYSYKFKKFLCASALGMVPGRPWNGKEEANGGYIIVSAEGDVLAYHIYNRGFFEDYLFNNTIFERASTTRHEYASIYEKDHNFYMKLNLQIRFAK